MLTNQEAKKIDNYIKFYLSPLADVYEEFADMDDFIVCCSMNTDFARKYYTKIEYYINYLSQVMKGEFALQGGITITLLEIQERLYQLKIVLNKVKGKESLHETAMLCLASSFDLAWLKKQISA